MGLDEGVLKGDGGGTEKSYLSPRTWKKDQMAHGARAYFVFVFAPFFLGHLKGVRED